MPKLPVPEYSHPRQPLQPLGSPLRHPTLPGSDGVHSLPPHEPDALQQPCDARHVVGPGLQSIRQVRGHILQAGHAAGSAIQQGLCPLPSAQQQPCALGAVQSLMAGQGHKGRPPPGQIHRQHPRRLGRVHDQGCFRLPAGFGNVRHRQDHAEHVGNVGAHHRPGPQLPDGPAKFLRRQVRPEKRRIDHCHRQARNGMQGPGHGVVLISGDHHPVPGPQQRPNGNIQSMGGACGDDNVFRLRNAQQLRRLLAAQIGRFLRPAGGGIAPPPRGAHIVRCLSHGPAHGGRLLQGGCPGVEIDHSAASRYPSCV